MICLFQIQGIETKQQSRMLFATSPIQPQLDKHFFPVYASVLIIGKDVDLLVLLKLGIGCEEDFQSHSVVEFPPGFELFLYASTKFDTTSPIFWYG